MGLEVHGQLAHIVQAERNLLGRLDAASATVRVGGHREQRDAEQQKMEQRLAQPAPQGGMKRQTAPRSLDHGLRTSISDGGQPHCAPLLGAHGTSVRHSRLRRLPRAQGVDECRRLGQEFVVGPAGRR